jgi:hypothetical protein
MNKPGRVVGDDLVVVVPEDVGGRLRGIGDHARQVDHRAAVHVQVGRPGDTHVRHYKDTTVLEF